MPNLMTACEAAERLHISKWTVYDLVRDGRLRAIRLTGKLGKLLFTEEDLDRTIRESADRQRP